MYTEKINDMYIRVCIGHDGHYGQLSISNMPHVCFDLFKFVS